MGSRTGDRHPRSRVRYDVISVYEQTRMAGHVPLLWRHTGRRNVSTAFPCLTCGTFITPGKFLPPCPDARAAGKEASC
jgi:hypothetical protein